MGTPVFTRVIVPANSYPKLVSAFGESDQGVTCVVADQMPCKLSPIVLSAKVMTDFKEPDLFGWHRRVNSDIAIGERPISHLSAPDFHTIGKKLDVLFATQGVVADSSSPVVPPAVIESLDHLERRHVVLNLLKNFQL